MQFKLFSFVTALLFATVFAAPQPGLNDAGLSLSARSCDICGNVCGADLNNLVNTIKSDINNIISATNELVSDIASKKACQCEIDDDLKAKVDACIKLIKDVISSIFTINWTCINFTLVWSVIDVFLSILHCVISFLLAFISYIVTVKVTILADVFQLFLQIPQLLCDALTKICNSIPTIKVGCWWLVDILQTTINQCWSTCRDASYCNTP